MAEPYPCYNLVKRWKEVHQKLEDLGVNPWKAGKIIREMEKHGVLTREIFETYIEWVRLRRAILRCVARHYVV